MVEYRLAKARVAGSNPVSRLIKNEFIRKDGLIFYSVRNKVRTLTEQDLEEQEWRPMVEILVLPVALHSKETARRRGFESRLALH